MTAVLADLVAVRDTYDPSSGTYAIPVEAFDALATVARAAYAVYVKYDYGTFGDAEYKVLRDVFADKLDLLSAALAGIEFA